MIKATQRSSWISLWQELRQRLLLWLISLIILAVCLLPLSNLLFNFFVQPLLKTLGANQSLIAIGILSGFWVPIELSLWLALFLSTPIFLFQVWCFIKPALKTQEKPLWRLFFFASFVLFFLGLLFCYQIILPICLAMLLHSTPHFVKVMPDIVNYLNFSFRLLLTFGLAAELPLIILLLCRSNITSVTQLRSWRRYVIIADFTLGMIIAPDVITQCLLAIPLWLLFELGLLVSQ